MAATIGKSVGTINTDTLDPNVDIPAGTYFGFTGDSSLWIPVFSITKEQLEQVVLNKLVSQIQTTNEVILEYATVTATPTGLPPWLTGGQAYDVHVEIQFKSQGVIPLFIWGIIGVIIAVLGIIGLIMLADFAGTWHSINVGARKFFSSDFGGIISALIIILIILAAVAFAWDYGKSKLKVGRHSTRGRRKVSG